VPFVDVATLTQAQANANGIISTALANTQVFFDEIPAPMVYVYTGQVSAIVPYGMFGRASANVVVEYKGVRSTAFPVRISDTAPGIFTLNTSGQGAIVNQDNSINGPSNGAEPGSFISIYATGEGQTNPPGQDGKVTGSALSVPRAPVVVRIAGIEADVLYAGSAPGSPAGVLQVNARIPQGVPRNTSVPIVLTIGGVDSQSNVTVAVR
jgi:uncharacterized protein (TIGR03437 family)